MVRFADPPDPLDDAFPLGDGVASDVAGAHCPYCGEAVHVLVDPGSGSHQDYVEDCPVCCRPWRVRVTFAGGDPFVDLSTEDEG